MYLTTKSKPDEIYSTQGIDHRSKAAFRADLERALEEEIPVPLPSYVREQRR